MDLRTRLHFSRRSLLRLGSGFFGSLGLASLPAWRVVAQAPEAAGGTETHGLSTFGDLALRADFPHFAYVNPQAPKGGQILLQPGGGGPNSNPTTFNTLNVFILKGDGAAGMGAIFDNLMAANSDEPELVLWSRRLQSMDFGGQEPLSLLPAQGGAFPRRYATHRP